MRIWGGVIAKLVLIGALSTQANLAYAWGEYDNDLECSLQNGNCIIKTHEGTTPVYRPQKVIYYIKNNKVDFNQNGNISGIFFKTPDRIDNNKQYIFNFESNLEFVGRELEMGRVPDTSLSARVPNTINITTAGTVDFTFAQIKNIKNTTQGGKKGPYPEDLDTSMYNTWGNIINVNNTTSKDVNLKALHISDSKNFVISDQGFAQVQYRDGVAIGASVSYERFHPAGLNTIFFSTTIKNPTKDSTNYALYAENSTINLQSNAHFYSSEIKDNHNKYGVYLKNSTLNVGNGGDIAYVVGDVHFSNLVNDNSSINLNMEILGKESWIPVVPYDKFGSSINFAYSKKSDLAGKNGILENLNYYGSIRNQKGLLNLSTMEYYDYQYKEYADKNEVPDTKLFQYSLDRAFDPFYKYQKLSDYKVKVPGVYAVENLKLENGKDLFDYINVGQGENYGQDSFTEKDKIFLTKDKLYIVSKTYTQKSEQKTDGDGKLNNVGHLFVDMTVERSADGEHGKDGSNGKKIAYTSLAATKSSTASLDSIKKTDFKAGNGTAGKNGTNAHLFGHGGNGGFGGHGGLLIV